MVRGRGVGGCGETAGVGRGGAGEVDVDSGGMVGSEGVREGTVGP